MGQHKPRPELARVIGVAMVFCLTLIVFGGCAGLFGEREGLYAAFGGFIGSLVVCLSCWIEHLRINGGKG